MELQALGQAQRNNANQYLVAGNTSETGEDSTLMRLNKSMAKVIIKLGARVTTLEAKVRFGSGMAKKH